MNFKIRHIVVWALLMVHCTAQAQEHLIRQFPGLDTIPSEHGPNRKHYTAIFYGFGPMFGSTDSAGSNINPGRSFWFSLGYKFKRRHSSFFNTGSELFMEYRNFNIAQTSQKVFGGRFTHEKERFSQVTFNLSLFMRFNLVKRGDHLGRYIDLYAQGIYVPIARHYTYDKIDPAYGAKSGKHQFSKLQYVERWLAQVGMRFGLSVLQVQVFYRPTSMFKKNDLFPWPELPRFGAGIILDFEQKTRE